MNWPIDPWFLLGGGVLGLVLATWATRSALKRDNAADWLQLKRLSDKGVSLEHPREVEFHFFVRTEASAKHVVELLASDGFLANHEQGHVEMRKRRGSPVHSDEGFLIDARKVIVLYGEALGDLRKRFTPLAEKENGYYLGWRAIDESPLGSASERDC